MRKKENMYQALSNLAMNRPKNFIISRDESGS